MPEAQAVITLNEKDRIEFEKGIYEAFNERNPDNWICTHYRLIGNCRYQPQVPYSDQVVILVKEDEKVIAGCSVNLNMNSPVLQMKQIGFIPNPLFMNAQHAEALVLFTLRNTAISPFAAGALIKETLESEMKKRGIHTLLGTCSDNVKIVYLKSGWKVIEEKINEEGIRKYLIKKEIN